MNSYDITSPIYEGNRSNSNETWKDCIDGPGRDISESDGALTDYTISLDTHDNDNENDNESDCAVNSSDRSSDRSVHFNENIEVFTHDNSCWLQPCGCCYCIWDYIYNHLLSIPILLFIVLFLFIIITTGFLFFLFYNLFTVL